MVSQAAGKNHVPSEVSQYRHRKTMSVCSVLNSFWMCCSPFYAIVRPKRAIRFPLFPPSSRSTRSVSVFLFHFPHSSASATIDLVPSHQCAYSERYLYPGKDPPTSASATITEDLLAATFFLLFPRCAFMFVPIIILQKPLFNRFQLTFFYPFSIPLRRSETFQANRFNLSDDPSNPNGGELNWHHVF